ncbi:MAG: HAMP domain-containing sensor histidine kinase [Rhodocyclaceae bacterium]|nr:HAMP domain-containing sensor histidine kinase [Rhodocyclaceae bacterium]
MTLSDAPDARPSPRNSLMWRVVVALAVFMFLLGGVLYVAVDRLVSDQFEALHGEQTRQLAAELVHVAEAELSRLDSAARLLATDADLNHAVYYHLFLEGEREHVQAALERVVKGFRLSNAMLLDRNGKAVARYGKVGAGDTAVTGPAAIVWRDNAPWAMAGAPILRDGQPIATLHLAQLAESLFPPTVLDHHGATVRLLPSGAPARGQVVELPAAGGDPVRVEVRAADTVAQALAQVQSILAVGVAAAGIVLVVAFAFFLRWQLQPLADLGRAAAAVGRGEFEQVVSSRGSGEIADLVARFNAMSMDLVKLRELQRRLAHQEQLSAIGRVAARVAHDINNPLTVITNTAQLAARETADPQLREDLALIRHHGERCMDTVKSLLEFGRPVRLDARRLDLSATVAEFAERWRVRAPETRLELAAAGEAWVEADALALERMLDNLLDNAREANPGGPIRLGLQRDRERVGILVADAGPGFSAEARARLFEPFFTTKTGGTGLGLASALAIARAHDGDIELAGETSGLRVWLPLTPTA